MRAKRVALEQVSGLSLIQPGPGEGGTSPLAKVPKKLLQMAVAQELTPRQQECVTLYYFQRLTMEEIGRQLGIGKATVCRHLQNSKKRLARVLAYVNWKP